jgi:molybdopterin-guanine dinucleotide biosynthesis protein A
MACSEKYGAPVISVCGYSGSGKSTLLEAVIPRLIAQGLSVAVVKHNAHGFAVDREGKDSDRFFKAGATVALRGPDEQFFRRNASSSLALEVILSELALDHDLLLVEGHKDTPLPKLWIGTAELSTPPDHVTDVEDILPWNCDRVGIFLDIAGKILPKAWRARPLFAGLLIGGKSSRMGRPKQMLDFNGSTLGEVAARALGDGIVDTVLGQDHARAQPGAHVVLLGAGVVPPALEELERLPDAPDLAGPLAGLLAAHRWAPRAAWVLAACDHPWLTASDIQALAAQRGPGAWAIFSRQPDGHPCPTLALYEPQALTVLERSVVARGADKARMAELFDHTHARVSQKYTCGSVSVNTPDDLAAEIERSAGGICDENAFRATTEANDAVRSSQAGPPTEGQRY